MNPAGALTPRNLSKVQSLLLAWFKENARDYPWRKTEDPYKVFLGEKLLQQTAAREHVVQAYDRLARKYPGIASLAAADPTEVLSIIRPLGLHRRAAELVGAAQVVASEFGGEFPQTIAELKQIPGIGEYIARSILCFALGRPVAIVDTNFARWLIRLHGLARGMPANPARNAELMNLAESVLMPSKAKDFNLAVIDLCASLCKPSNPRCPDCPIQELCFYGSQSNDSGG